MMGACMGKYGVYFPSDGEVVYICTGKYVWSIATSLPMVRWCTYTQTMRMLFSSLD